MLVFRFSAGVSTLVAYVSGLGAGVNGFVAGFSVFGAVVSLCVARAHVYALCARVRARIFTKNFLVVD